MKQEYQLMQRVVQKLKQKEDLIPNPESDDDKEDRNAIGNGKSVVNVTEATIVIDENTSGSN